MNFQNIKEDLKVVISVGDESGIGPEIILKAICSNEILDNIDFILVGSKRNLQNTYKHLRSLGLENLANPKDLKIHDLEISSTDNVSKSSYGNSSFYYLTKAIELVKQHPNSALVTGPICKKSWSLSGHYFSGQTEVLAKSCGVKNVGMLFTAKSPITGWRFNTLLATTHIPLCEVPKQLNTELIHSKLDLLKKFCNTYIHQPTLKIAGLNPHAGEEGQIGNEEISDILPAILKFQKTKHCIVDGPFPADGFFGSKDYRNYDVTLAMYHDQALIPLKLLSFFETINVTLGLPIIRTSPGHGTGINIAKDFAANCNSFYRAILFAAQMMSTRNKSTNEH